MLDYDSEFRMKLEKYRTKNTLSTASASPRLVTRDHVTETETSSYSLDSVQNVLLEILL